MITSKYLIPKGYAAIAVYPFIFVREKRLKQHSTLVYHERIHLRQQAELLILPFYLWYFIEYMVRFIRYRNHYAAYKNISFEREAYSNENNYNYLYYRKLWSFLKYF